MASLLHKVFWSVPALRDLVATVRGFQLARERYGATYRESTPRIRERITWSAEQMREYIDGRVIQIVRTAANHVPYYRDSFAAAGIDPREIRGVDDLPKLPLVEKAALREDPYRFIDERIDPKTLVWSNTSGTTGTPLKIASTRECKQIHYAYFEARHREVAGIQFGRKPYAMIGGQLVAPIERTRPPFWCYNHIQKQLYLSSYHISDANLPAYVAELRRRPYHALMGYPSSLHAIARYLIDSGERPLRIPIVSTSSETLFEHQRRDIERAFGARVFDQYGCAEMCVFASESTDGVMYLSPGYGFVEILGPDRNAVEDGEVGEVVCTGLLNEAQPLIRYRIGDRAALTRPRPQFPGLPVVSRLEGRIDKIIRTRDGRRIGRLDPVFKGVVGVKECQIVQEDWDRFRLRVVAGPEYADHVGRLLVSNLRERIGDVRVEISIEPFIERSANGKFEAVVSRMSDTAHTPTALTGV